MPTKKSATNKKPPLTLDEQRLVDVYRRMRKTARVLLIELAELVVEAHEENTRGGVR